MGNNIVTRRIQRILIANRGEIASRIADICRELGIEVVGIASTADQDLPLRWKVDHWVVMPGDRADETYLNQALILEIAQKYHVDAIHPGYGFLSEDAEFAEAVEALGILFIGPSSSAMRTMGSKRTAKTMAQSLQIPVIEGELGADQSESALLAAAQRIGYPLLIKATHGGGGKGMRLVERVEDFLPALHACQREAGKAFGNDSVMLERFILNPRHIEVQVFGDMSGKVVSLSERDCSLQRRHQKVIEEAPAAGLAPELREELATCAVRLAEAVAYVGAGTVEFLVSEDGHFYFLEMNTRLQVEHPVTDAILGIRLIEAQIRAAEGWSVAQIFPQPLAVTGHAIEARIYAEDPSKEFLPMTGELTAFHLEIADDAVQLHTGYAIGNKISIHYDPMLAKLIVWAPTRVLAWEKLRQALQYLKIEGIQTNRDFLLGLSTRPDVSQKHPSIQYLDTVLKASPESLTEMDAVLSVSALCLDMISGKNAQYGTSQNLPTYDFWSLSPSRRILLQLEDEEVVVTWHRFLEPVSPRQPKQCPEGVWWFEFRNQTYHITRPRWLVDTLEMTINDIRYQARVLRREVGALTLLTSSGIVHCTQPHHKHVLSQAALIQDQLQAPMPGRVLAVLALEKSRVSKGDPIVILEAMKMEHTIRAPITGVIDRIYYQAGDFVEEGTQLAEVIAIPEESANPDLQEAVSCIAMS